MAINSTRDSTVVGVKFPRKHGSRMEFLFQQIFYNMATGSHVSLLLLSGPKSIG